MSTVALIDLSAIFRQAWHASEHEEIGHAVARTVSTVVTSAAGSDYTAVCVDRPPYKRRLLFDGYKANREKAPAAMYEQLRHVEAELSSSYGMHIIGAEGYESDDVIGKIATWASGLGHEVTIFSADKDLMQLVGPNVSIISTATKVRYDSPGVTAKLGVEPSKVPDYLAIVGDASDNIFGIKGVGPKTAAAWLSEFGTLEGIIAAADRLTPERFRAVVKESAEALRMSRKLTGLMLDVPIDPEVILTKKERTSVKQESLPTTVTDDEPQPVVENAESVPQQEQTTAIATTTTTAVADNEPWDRRLEPRSAAQGWQIANVLFRSRIFGSFPNPEAILAIMMTGRALGLDTVTSLRNFDLIEGKPSPKAQLLIGLVKKHPACEWLRFVGGDEKSATWETKRRDEPEPTKMTYTYEQAVAAGHVKTKDGGVKKNWRDPLTMLRWRSGLALCRVVYPDVISGLYAVEEFDES